MEGNVLNVSILVDGYEALSAGTEVNDEFPDHTAFLNQTQPDAGDPVLGGVVLAHRGFAPAVDGGILSYPEFSGADFKVEGYEFIGIEVSIVEVDVSQTPAPAISPALTRPDHAPDYNPESGRKAPRGAGRSAPWRRVRRPRVRDGGRLPTSHPCKRRDCPRSRTPAGHANSERWRQ